MSRLGRRRLAVVGWEQDEGPGEPSQAVKGPRNARTGPEVELGRCGARPREDVESARRGAGRLGGPCCTCLSARACPDRLGPRPADVSIGVPVSRVRTRSPAGWAGDGARRGRSPADARGRPRPALRRPPRCPAKLRPSRASLALPHCVSPELWTQTRSL